MFREGKKEIIETGSRLMVGRSGGREQEVIANGTRIVLEVTKML